MDKKIWDNVSKTIWRICISRTQGSAYEKIADLIMDPVRYSIRNSIENPVRDVVIEITNKMNNK
jgi:hypothetical protein